MLLRYYDKNMQNNYEMVQDILFNFHTQHFIFQVTK